MENAMLLRLWALTLSAVLSASAAFAQEPHRPSAQRGALAVRGQPAMNPPTWLARTFENVWQQWGLREKPADFDRQFRDRYGLLPAPYENAGLPMGLHYATGPFGKGIVNDCLLCHTGTVAGQTILGVANASLDLQSLADDLWAQSPLPVKVPFRFSHVRGTIDPVNPVAFLASFRDVDLNLAPERRPVEYSRGVSSDPPAWWLLNWTGTVLVNSTRVDMVNLLTPLNSAQQIKRHETTFADIHAFVMSLDAPKYPFAVDVRLAATGRGVFEQACVKCHGTYGPEGKYPNKVIPLGALGTDPTLARSITKNHIDIFNNSWFGQEKNPDGGWYQHGEVAGYQAPPLDGVWATAPYFHNASVPTIYHVLNSKARPKIFTRSFGTGVEEYDAERVGWKITTVDQAAGPDVPPHLRRRVYDTHLPGQGNAGHTFGDDLSDEQRQAVIEYLKTL
jgi:mono/diheme cytochrome c family protein